MDIKEILQAKRHGALDEKRIEWLIKNIKSGHIKDSQIVMLAEKYCTFGATDEEVLNFAKYMAKSGIMLELNQSVGFFVDKQSAGNYSDGATLILLSVLSSLGLKFVRVISTVYGKTGALVSKLNSIDGFNAKISKQKVLENINSCGVGLFQDDGEIAPVAAKIYKICEEYGIYCEPIISACIIASKIATGTGLVVYDIKEGEGAILPNTSADFANRLVRVSRLAGINAVAIISDLNWPISASVGRNLELQEIKDTLKASKEYVGSNLITLSREMGVCVILSAKLTSSRSKAIEMFDAEIESGRAYNQFCKVISTYGGDVSNISRTEILSDTAVSYITSPKDGYVKDINLESLYSSIRELIYGKVVDQTAGAILMCAEGDKVVAGQKLAKIFYSHDNKRFFRLHSRLEDSFEIGSKKIVTNNLFYKVVV